MSEAERRASWRLSGPALGLLALVTVFVVLLWWRGQLAEFASLSNLKVVLHGKSFLTVASLGMLLVIVSGGIDLSVGSVMALVTVVTMQTYRLVYNGPEYGLPTAVVGWLGDRDLLWVGGESQGAASAAALAAGLLTGCLCGVCNGLVVTQLRLAPFVATLGMISVARGLAVWLSNRTRVSFRGPRPDWVDALSRTSSDTLFFDPGVWSAALLALLLAVVLTRTVFGRYCYAIGANETAAWRSGIPVGRTKLLIYALAGLFAGWAGVLLFAHGNGGDSGAAVTLELEAIAAVVIGGASLSGGRGTVVGTLLGVCILAVLENGVELIGVPVEVKNILIGVIIVAGMAVSSWRQRQGE
jgi:ribose transport system permease protein